MAKAKKEKKEKTVTVIWLHPSIRMCGSRYGEPVELSAKDAELYKKKRWAKDPEPTPSSDELQPGEIEDPEAYAAALEDGTITEIPQEAPDAEGDPDGG